jgi:hypothetical protein
MTAHGYLWLPRELMQTGTLACPDATMQRLGRSQSRQSLGRPSWSCRGGGDTADDTVVTHGLPS